MSNDQRHDQRCQMCTANDLDGLAEKLAERLWEGRCDPKLNDPVWNECGIYWQSRMRGLARDAIDIMRSGSIIDEATRHAQSTVAAWRSR